MGKGGGSSTAGGDGFMRSLQRFDAFPKVNEDFFQRTLSGGVITLVATIVVAVLFVSSEMEEVMGLADRVLVMHEGEVTGELSRDELTEERIMRLATGNEAVLEH